ncbi:hypothetical protein Mal48_13820 [Thalassoglobus polymorphus]|uniref:Uncharacterized protein n=1 Tax=Thalassoglobus polymorphus TaxID=2527994 RepID=A0A517QKI7_9PLAN|nr:hypothetical protein Mal48_13820 [Thalassoglobus polymorphus]
MAPIPRKIIASLNRQALDQYARPCTREEYVSLVKLLFATKQNLNFNSRMLELLALLLFNGWFNLVDRFFDHSLEAIVVGFCV